MDLQSTHGFTLIELLIVVAIIAILAAIAIPNYLLAQTRSKVARVQADLQTAATALESYNIDNNIYPYYDNPEDTDYQHLSHYLTTPVAYLTSIPVDIFFNQDAPGTVQSVKNFYHYLTEDYKPGVVQHRLTALGITSPNTEWMVYSLGPDRWDDLGKLIYDPTNGTVSNGDILRIGP